MKKLCALLLLCALSLAAAAPVCAADDVTEYRIDEIGLTVEIPNEFTVFTREMDENDPALPKYGFTKDSLLSFFQEDSTYLSAPNEAGNLEVAIRVFKNDSDVSTEDEDDLLWFERFYTENVPGCAIQNSALYSTPQGNWCCFHYTITKDDQSQDHAINFVHATEESLYSFLYYSYGAPLPEGSADLICSIVDSAVLDDESSPDHELRSGPFTYENEDYAFSLEIPAHWDQFLVDSQYTDEAYFIPQGAPDQWLFCNAFDYWASLSKEEQSQITPSEIYSQYFTPTDLDTLFEVPYGTFSRTRYGDVSYFTRTDSSVIDGVSIVYTDFIAVNNGYLYYFSFEGTVDDKPFADVAQILASLRFLDGAAAAQPSHPAADLSADELNTLYNTSEAPSDAEDAAAAAAVQRLYTIPPAVLWILGLAFTAAVAILVVHLCRRAQGPAPDSPRSVRDAEARSRKGPDLD